jgi:hypothetical protein
VRGVGASRMLLLQLAVHSNCAACPNAHNSQPGQCVPKDTNRNRSPLALWPCPIGGAVESNATSTISGHLGMSCPTLWRVLSARMRCWLGTASHSTALPLLDAGSPTLDLQCPAPSPLLEPVSQYRPEGQYRQPQQQASHGGSDEASVAKLLLFALLHVPRSCRLLTKAGLTEASLAAAAGATVAAPAPYLSEW